MDNNIQKTELLDYESRFIAYNNYGFIRDLDSRLIVKETLVDTINNCISKNQCKVYSVCIEGEQHLFIVKYLEWDSNYFNFPCFHIEIILFKHKSINILNKAITNFNETHVEKNAYYTINIPTEDLILNQGVSSTKFKLIETRLNYFINVRNLSQQVSFSDIKTIVEEDIPILRDLSRKMRNPFDRVHADPTFSDEQADLYLGKFAEEAAKGFSDIFLKVMDKENKPFGFLAGNNPQNIAGKKVSKLVLAAVDSKVQKGRLEDLTKEMIFRLKQLDVDFLTTITQSSNIPAIRTWERVGFNLFKVTNLFSFKND